MKMTMKEVLTSVFVVALLAWVPPVFAEDAVGEWDMSYDFQGTDVPGTMAITKGDDNRFKGVWTDDNGPRDLRDVKFDGSTLTFLRDVLYQGQDYELPFKGTIEGDAITGTFESGVGPFEVEGSRKAPAAAEAAPASSVGSHPLVGTWEANAVSDLGEFSAVIGVRLQLVGTYEFEGGTTELENIKLDGDKVTFNMTIDLQGAELAVSFEGKLDGSTITGEFISDLGNAQVTAKRAGGGSIQSVVNDIMAALKAQDFEKMTSFYADDFSSDQGGGKEEMKQFLIGAKEQGMLDGLDVNIEGMTVKVDGDKATVEGIEVEGAFGVASLGFELEKRDGKWLVTYQSQY